MSQLIITLKQEKDGKVQLDCDGTINVSQMVHMAVSGFDKLKLQFCEDLLKLREGKVEIDTIEIKNEIKDLIEKIIDNSKKS